MKIQIMLDSPTQSPVDLAVLACYSDYETHSGFTAFNDALHGQLAEAVKNDSWSGKKGDVFVTNTFFPTGPKRLALVGLGELRSADVHSFRQATAQAIKTAANLQATTLSLVLPQELPASVSAEALGQAIAEGAYLANYRFEGYARDRKPHHYVQSVQVASSLLADEVSQGFAHGESVAAGVNLARDLVNIPGNMMTPTKMAEEAMAIAERYGMQVEVLNRNEMQELGMGALLAVAQGSVEPPKLIAIRYQGRDTWDNVIGLVGKGITFDSGGVSLKTAQGMENMKTDMGGGASVLGAMEAIGRLKPSINVIGVVPATENMPSGSSYKPGDVLTAMTGKTIEVLNTDAEGRLALADAVAYAKEQGASRLIDLATLTGAALVALGKTTTAVMTNDDDFLAEFMAATNEAGERAWQLPAFDEYWDLIKSDIADVKNTGGRFAGTITAGLFIRAFVEDTPWIHLDIAGTAYGDKGTALNPKGATGVMVRSLVAYVLGQAQK